jgi:hypothetical protein
MLVFFTGRLNRPARILALIADVICKRVDNKYG